MILIDRAGREKLVKRTIGCLRANDFLLPEKCEFEPPCSIKWMQIQHSLSMNAFSYAVSGYYFACRIGRYVSIGENVQIGRHNHPTDWATTSPFFSTPYVKVLDFTLAEAGDIKPNDFMLGKSGQRVKITTIGNDVWIGHGAFISPGVNIADGAVIGACAVVTKDVPPYAIAVGVPATVKRLRFDERIVERMLALKWWRYAFWDLRGASTTEPTKFIDTLESKISDNAIQEYKPQKLTIADILDDD
jgi:acetyltransferase-like isoleucine patch superfamily enzyme